MSDDWFRNEIWTEEIETKFFARLDRARSGRDQYLAIQCITLADRDPETALKLVEIYFDTRKSTSDDNRVLEAKARAHLALENTEAEIEAYAAVLNHEADHPYSLTNVAIELPYLIASQSRVGKYGLAKSALAFAEHHELNFFPVLRFKFHAAHALIASEEGHACAAQMHALKALEEAVVTDSGLPYHQTLGLVRHVESYVMARLRELIELGA